MTRYEDSFVLKDEVSKSLIKINNSLQAFDGKLKASQMQLTAFQKKTESIRNLGKGMQDFGNKMTVGVTLPIIGAMTYASKMGMEFQDAEMRLQTMLGSAEAGTKMFNDIVKMGAETPFEAKDLLRASTLMLNFGVETKKVLPYMSMLGDISGGNAERFQSLALAFSQVSANGKLQGQDLLQMVNAGFNPLQIISEKTGKSMMQLRGEMADGAITIDKVVQAMQWATGEGGRFNGMMQKMSKTASGKLSTMMDNFNTAMAQLGQVLLPYVTKGIEAITAALEKFTKLSPGTQKMILLFGGIAAAVGPLITIFGSLLVAIASAPAAFAALAAGIKIVGGAVVGLSKSLMTLLANPVVLTIVGWTAVFAGIAAGIWAVVEAIKTLVGWFQHLKRMKIPNLRTDNLTQENYQKLAGLQASMGEKSFSEKYGQNISKQVSSYRQNNIRNTTNKRNNNYNFYGNINSSGSSMLDNILNNSNNVPAFAG